MKREVLESALRQQPENLDLVEVAIVPRQHQLDLHLVPPFPIQPDRVVLALHRPGRAQGAAPSLSLRSNAHELDDGAGADIYAALSLPRDFVESIAHELGVDPLVAIQPFSKKPGSKAALSLQMMAARAESSLGISRLETSALATLVAIELIREQRFDRAPAAGALSQDKLDRFYEAVDKGIEQSLSNRHLAKEVGLSTSSFQRAFQRSIGMTPQTYIMGRRLEWAKSLLENRDAQIAEVAFRAGFASQSHLTLRFRERFGITPRQYQTGAMRGAVQGPIQCS